MPGEYLLVLFSSILMFRRESGELRSDLFLSRSCRLSIDLRRVLLESILDLKAMLVVVFSSIDASMVSSSFNLRGIVLLVVGSSGGTTTFAFHFKFFTFCD